MKIYCSQSRPASGVGRRVGSLAALTLAWATLGACDQDAPAETPQKLVGVRAKADESAPTAAFLCRVTRGDSPDPFFRFDTVYCEGPEETLFRERNFEILAANGDPLRIRSGVDSDRPVTVLVREEHYPLRVRSEGIGPQLDGLDPATRLVSEVEISGPDGWGQLRGPALLFDIWTVEVENLTELARVSFGAYTVSAGAGHVFSVSGTESDEVEVSEISRSLDTGETIRLRMLAPADSALHGNILISGSDEAIELDRGGEFLLTAMDGLVPRPGYVAPSSGEDIVRCAGGRVGHVERADEPVDDADADEEEGDVDEVRDHDVAEADAMSCVLVTRPGIEIGEATLWAGEVEHKLPLDGTPVAIADIDSATTLRALVQVKTGVVGVDLEKVGWIEGELEPSEAGAHLELPFALMHVEVEVAPSVFQAFFQRFQPYEVVFTRPIQGWPLFRGTLSLALNPGAHHLWIATTPGSESVTGKLDLVDASTFEVESFDHVELLSGARYGLDMSGLNLKPSP